MLYPKFEQVRYTTQCCLKIAERVANSVDPHEMLSFAESNLGLHCLLRPPLTDTFSEVYHMLRIMLIHIQTGKIMTKSVNTNRLSITMA